MAAVRAIDIGIVRSMSEVRNIDHDRDIFNARESGNSWSQVADEFELSISSARRAYSRAKAAKTYQIFIQDKQTKKIPVCAISVTGDFLEAVVIAIKRYGFLQSLTLPSWEFVSDASESLKITDVWRVIGRERD